MKGVVLGHTILWGVFVLSGIFSVISCLIKMFQSWSSNESKGKQILNIVLCGFITWGSIHCFYIMANKYVSNPVPSDCQIVMEEGEKWMQYQDPTHFCHADEENSSWFVSRIPADSKPNKDDVCEICGWRYLHHDTPQEQSYFKWMFLLNNTDFIFLPSQL